MARSDGRHQPWIKLWTEARNDGKLRCLSDREHRIWFCLLCYSAEQAERGTIRGTWKVLAAECANGDVEALRAAVTEMQSLQLVTCVTCNESEAEIVFPSFAKRQAKYPSEEKERVAERVAKHRAAKRLRQAAPRVTTCNEPVTSQNDSEVEVEREKESVCVSRTHTREGQDLADWEEAIAELGFSADGRLLAAQLQDQAEIPSILQLEAWRFIHAAHVVQTKPDKLTWNFFIAVARRASRREFDGWHSPPPKEEPAATKAAPAPRRGNGVLSRPDIVAFLAAGD